MIRSFFKNKMAEIRENGKSKKDKGFTLVELIVVIVILAILIGVTIGGIYMYVGQSRENTDVNNASSITSVCGTANADQAVYDAIEDGKTVVVKWTDATAVDSITAHDSSTATTDGFKNGIINYVKKVLPDGLPKSQTGRGFTLTFTGKGGTDPGKSVSVSCVVNAS